MIKNDFTNNFEFYSSFYIKQDINVFVVEAVCGI